MTDNSDEKKTVAPLEDNPQNQESTNDLTKERYKQIVEGSKKEVEKYREMVISAEVERASKDANSLLELHEKDPKLANEVAKKFNFDKFGGYDNFINNGGTSAIEDRSSGFTEEEFEKMYQKRRQVEEHERSLKKADKVISKIKDEELQEKAKNYFEKISNNKMLDEESALEFAEMATLYVSRDKLKKEKLDEGIAMLGSTGLSTSKKNVSKSKEDLPYIAGGKLIYPSNEQN